MRTHPASSKREPDRSCPACDVTKGWKEYCPASFLPGDSRRIMECSRCGLSILWPLPASSELGTYYRGGYFDFERHREEGKGLYFAGRLKAIKPKGRFLDIGCATGFFLNGIRRNCAWEVFGLETGRDAARHARNVLNLDVKNVPLERAGYPRDSFDYIHLNNVLEHVTDPLAVLTETGRILKPGGRIFMAVPNGRVDRHGYLDYHRRFGKPASSKDGHLFFFSASALQALVPRAGLRIENSFSCGLKRSLRVLGWWPRRRGWERPYEGRDNDAGGNKVIGGTGRSHRAAYYLFKHTWERLLRFPGMTRWAYDYIVHLTK